MQTCLPEHLLYVVNGNNGTREKQKKKKNLDFIQNQLFFLLIAYISIDLFFLFFHL